MAKYNAAHAQFWFEIGGQPEDTFQVLEMYGSETISQLYRFELSLISPVENDLNLSELVNQPAKLIILRDEDHKELYGILSELEEIGRGKDYAFFRGVLVPRCWRLSLNYQSRIFQNKSVPDIITDVLKGAGFRADDFRLDLKSSYQPREYCVQYRETDLSFISRLMEYEGISYFFEHTGGKDLIVMTDDNSKYPKIDAPDEIDSFVGQGFMPTDEETIHELSWHEKVVTGKVILKDYNYRTPETALSAESQLDQDSPGLYYDYGDHFKTAAQGKALAKIRNQEIEAARRIITGAGSCRGFHPGHTFTLGKHYRETLNGDYLLTQVSHYGSQAAGMGHAGDGAGAVPTYRNEFTCIPADIQYRSQRLTPEPRIPGIMTARVESSGGEYAHLDEEGRYKVKMPFDLTDAGQGKASRAIRLAQPYTGSGYGMHFPVHAGTELVWACIDGNVDRPLGLSSVPNPSQTTPVAAQNKSQNIIRSAAGNELMMDDLKDETQIGLRTADGHTVVLDDKEDKIEITTTKKNTMTMDDKNQCITVQTTDGHMLVMDDKNTKITVQSKNGHYMTINDGSGSESITLSDKDGKNTLIIDISNNKIVIETKDGSIDMHAPNGTIDIKATALKIETSGDTELKANNVSVKADVDLSLKAQNNISEEASMDYSQKGMNIKSEASMDHKTSGMNVTSEASINQQVKGTMVTVEATTMNTIKGMPVMIN
jgi:type VI secretion system secreted protein VgrG